MWICLALFELFCAPTFSPPDSIYWQGFEEMYISYDRPSLTSTVLVARTGSSSFLTSSAYLVDGKVSTPTRITWDSDISAGINDYVRLTLTFASHDLNVVAILCPLTAYAIPAGVKVEVLVHGDSFIVRTVQFNNGSTGIIVPYIDADAITGTTAVRITIYNDLNGSTWATAAQPFDIGEIWFGTLVEFKTTTDPQYGLVDPTTNRRSHNNNPWPLYGKPYRTFSADLIPMSDAKAYTGTKNFDVVRNALARANSALVLPRIYTPGTTTQNATDINQLAIYGRPDSIEPMKAYKDGVGLWTSRLTFSEAPP